MASHVSYKTNKALPLLLAACFCTIARALNTAPSTTTTIFDQLRLTPLTRASDGKNVALPSLWRSKTPLGLGDETAVIAFLRHFG
mmetsp:Transcript_156/g.226  ORF Transcript_156/g.226 Transcript_156/m.226 type:complete len:85 (-) Transcript_156:684-938(-)